MEIKQIIFLLTVILTLSVFYYSVSKIIANIRLLKNPYPVSDIGKRINKTLTVAFGQTKIFRFPLIGFFHALVFWGFLVIAFGSLEMIIDGIFGTERLFAFAGIVYNLIIASGDIFGLIIAILIIVFLIRRWFLNIKRFTGKEMRHRDHVDASFALILIFLLMISLLAMNTGYVGKQIALKSEIHGWFPVSFLLLDLFPNFTFENFHLMEQINWWIHILMIFFFANYLPYSKHFHVFMSLPNVFFSRLGPLTQMTNMQEVSDEVKLMLDPNAAFAEPEGDVAEPARFGIKDAADGTWKNYIDSLTCTQCGRCTSVCPANLTGKKLSPRKVVLDFRRRMEEVSAELRKNNGETKNENHLFDKHTSFEEIWACTTCNACAQECPVNIDHPTLILDIWRYIFMEESAAPTAINMMSTNIENNGAPWQYPPTSRMNWANDLFLNDKND